MTTYKLNFWFTFLNKLIGDNFFNPYDVQQLTTQQPFTVCNDLLHSSVVSFLAPPHLLISASPLRGPLCLTKGTVPVCSFPLLKIFLPWLNSVHC